MRRMPLDCGAGEDFFKKNAKKNWIFWIWQLIINMRQALLVLPSLPALAGLFRRRQLRGKLRGKVYENYTARS